MSVTGSESHEMPKATATSAQRSTISRLRPPMGVSTSLRCSSPVRYSHSVGCSSTNPDEATTSLSVMNNQRKPTSQEYKDLNDDERESHK
mmetsp:Transcript_21109/g.44017  ORF Transcript_21109/g.44017 Transcript_21109/m.44017 type:complete len:90 (+) Transcript_21109:322-591(+)